MIFFRKNPRVGEVWRLHVAAKLKEPRCWICEHALRDLDRDFFWFTSEQYYEPKVVDKMRLAHGFCPTHTRHFLRTGANAIITTVYSYLTWYMIGRLNAARDILLQKRKQSPRELCLQATEALRPRGACPMCETLQIGEQINIHALVQTLALSDVRDAFESSPGLCLPHFREAASGAPWKTIMFLNADMQRRLSARLASTRSSAALLEQAVGVDKEMALKRITRGKQYSELRGNDRVDSATYIEVGKPDPSWSPSFAELLASLAEPGCPVCSACDQGVRHYVEWLAQQMEAPSLMTAGSDASYHVCPEHLWALFTAGHERAAILIGKRTFQEWLARLDKLTEGLRFRPSEHTLERLRQGVLTWCGAGSIDFGPNSECAQSRRRKASAIVESPQARLDALRAVAFRAHECEACRHVRTITRRRLDLILRSVEDSLGRKAYHAASGLCLRHCIDAAALAEVPAALAELLSAQIARLRVLEWELGECSRKENWSVRYEAKGPESDAWYRAAKQFSGV